MDKVFSKDAVVAAKQILEGCIKCRPEAHLRAVLTALVNRIESTTIQLVKLEKQIERHDAEIKDQQRENEKL